MTEGLDAAGQASNSGQGRQLSVRLAVPEMDCPSCAQKVDKSLQRVNGITETTLQPTTGTATVTYDPDRTAEADVVAAIEGAGYEVAGNEDDSNGKSGSEMDIAPPSEIWTSPRAIKTSEVGQVVCSCTDRCEIYTSSLNIAGTVHDESS